MGTNVRFLTRRRDQPLGLSLMIGVPLKGTVKGDHEASGLKNSGLGLGRSSLITVSFSVYHKLNQRVMQSMWPLG